MDNGPSSSEPKRVDFKMLALVAAAALMAMAPLSVVAEVNDPEVGASGGSQEYVSGGGTLWCDFPVNGIVIGGGCFYVGSGKSTFAVTISDDLIASVGASLMAVDGSGNELWTSWKPFCGSTTTPIPSATREVWVAVDGPVMPEFGCPLTSAYGVSGTIYWDA